MLTVAAEDATGGVVANPVAFSVDGSDGDLDALGLSFAVRELSPDAAAGRRVGATG